MKQIHHQMLYFQVTHWDLIRELQFPMGKKKQQKQPFQSALARSHPCILAQILSRNAELAVVSDCLRQGCSLRTIEEPEPQEQNPTSLSSLCLAENSYWVFALKQKSLSAPGDNTRMPVHVAWSRQRVSVREQTLSQADALEWQTTTC